jgi:S1-C subfamily serine protease
MRVFIRRGYLAFLLAAAAALTLAPPPPVPPARAQDANDCTSLPRQGAEAFERSDFKRMISLARQNLASCRQYMGTRQYVEALFTLLVGLNSDGEFQEAVEVAGRCLEADAREINCGYGKGQALYSLGRVGEARRVAEQYLALPALTDNDVRGKAELRTLLAKVNATALAPAPKPAPAPAPMPAPPQVRGGSYGTGFYVSESGHIVTNWHVAKDCRVLQTANGAPLRVLASDAAVDLALLQVAGVKPAAMASFSQADAVLGESIIVFGFPLTGLLASSGNLTTGIVSATAGLHDNPRHLQISAPVQPGNSGGPLLDQSGNVVGVVVAKLDAATAASLMGDIPQNVNFAIKGREVLSFLARSRMMPSVLASSPKLSTESVATTAAAFTVQIVCSH